MHPVSLPRSRTRRALRSLRREIAARPLAYAVLGLSFLAGPLFGPLVFPDAATGLGVMAGLGLGAFSALSAQPQRSR